MNVTMPAPSPTSPPPVSIGGVSSSGVSSSGPSAAPSNARVAGRERPTTSPSARHRPEERTFEEQLDEVAVALGITAQPVRREPSTMPQTSPPDDGVASVVATVAPTAAAPADPASADTLPGATASATPAVATAAPSETAFATPAVAMAPPIMTETAAPGALPPVLAGPATVDHVAVGATHVPVPVASDLIAPSSVPADANLPISADDVDASPLLAPPVAGASPTEPSATSDMAADPTTDQSPVTAALASASTDVAAFADTDIRTDVTVDVTVDITAEFDGVETSVADVTTPPAAPILAAPVRRADGPTISADHAVAVLVESADEPAAPLRVAPPTTIAVDLNDEGLGPLRVVATSEQRTVHLTVSAAEAVVREALVRQQSDLRHDLADAGLQLGSFDVDAGAPDRNRAEHSVPQNDVDRPTARSGAATAATAPLHPVPVIHDDDHDHEAADRHLDLRL